MSSFTGHSTLSYDLPDELSMQTEAFLYGALSCIFVAVLKSCGYTLLTQSNAVYRFVKVAEVLEHRLITNCSTEMSIKLRLVCTLFVYKA